MSLNVLPQRGIVLLPTWDTRKSSLSCREKEIKSVGNRSSLFVTLANPHPHKKEFMFLACLQVLPSPAMPRWPPCIYAMDWIIHTTQNPLTHSVIKTGRAWLQEWLSSRWKKFLDSKWDLLPLLLWTLKLSLPRRRVKIPTITTISELQNASASVSNFWSNNNPFAMQALWQAANLPEKAGNSRLTSGTLHSHVAWEKRKKKDQERPWGYFQWLLIHFVFLVTLPPSMKHGGVLGE